MESLKPNPSVPCPCFRTVKADISGVGLELGNIITHLDQLERHEEADALFWKIESLQKDNFVLNVQGQTQPELLSVLPALQGVFLQPTFRDVVFTVLLWA